MKKTPLKKSNKTLSRSRVLRSFSKSTPARVKREIQAELRIAVSKRDGGCVLRNHAEAGACSGPLQAEHLITRSNSQTFADLRNIVCLCQRHHIFWKPQNSRLYWELIRDIIGEERWRWYLLADADRARNQTRMTLHDWQFQLTMLKRHNAGAQEQPHGLL